MDKYDSYKKDYLGVGEGHSIYYECYGNPNGKPILFLHGGPGLGFDEGDKRFFDPKVWNVILFDQRGAGRSKPSGSIEHNTTPDLISDINKLLEHLNIDKVVLFGGSWGSTLALIYAIQNKQRVGGMIVRGIYLSKKNEEQRILDTSIKDFYPEIWERLMSLVPEKDKGRILDYFYEKMTTGDMKEREKYAFEWSLYESCLVKMGLDFQKVAEEIKKDNYFALSLIEMHYIVNNCFVEDNYILNNAHILSDIPVSIIHGRFDFVCPPINAWDLHKQIKNSKLFFEVAAHSSSEPAIEQRLISEVKRFENLV